MSSEYKQQNMSRVDWPAGFDRTDSIDRSRNNKFDVTLSRSFDDLEAELDRIGVDSYQYSFDADQRKTDNRPYSRARPDDPSFVLRWTMDGEDYAVACDEYTKLRDNVRAVGLYLREKRKMENRPVVTGQSEFATARLPSGDDDAVATPVPPHEVLDVDPNASEDEIRSAYQKRMVTAHPDQGGSDEEFHRIKRAKEAMLDGE